MASFFSTLFRGGAEREAANRNRNQVAQYRADSLATLDDALPRTAGMLESYGQNARIAHADSYNLYRNLRDRGMGYFDGARTGGVDALNRGRASYDDVAALGRKYGAATDLLLDSLGTRGAEGNQRAVNAFQAGPGYQFTLDQGLQALNRRRAAAGMLNSGNADADALSYGTGLANQTYGDWQDRLGGFREGELSATGSAAAGRAAMDRALADFYANDAAARAGLDTSATGGQAAANTARAGTEQWLGNGLAGLYSNDAQNRLGVYNNVMGGNVAANNLQAQGESQGGRNFLGTALNLANLALGRGGFLRGPGR